MTINTKTSDRLLTEVERQQKYLDRLPDDFSFPLFNAAQALESQRRSGYRNTAAAAREIIDNAIEAGATRIDVCFERPKQLRAHQRAESISAVAFIDNGSGMIPKMARYALSWGSGTHFDDPGFIGKFGFGLPNASINQTRLVEVYTKTADTVVVTKAWLDAREVKEHGLQRIQEPVESALPVFVQTYLDKKGIAFEHGTVVVWVNPDRITYRTPAVMREHLVDDFGVTYRYMLPKVDLYVENTRVEAVDPLFLTPGARYFLDEAKGGALPLGLDGGESNRVVSETVALADGSCMHDLRDSEGAVAFDAPDHRLPRSCLGFVAHSRLEQVSLRMRLVGIETLGKDQAEATAREALVVAGHRFCRRAIPCCRDTRHRRDG